MDRTRFDALARQVARQTTRRETVGALLGGAMLLNHLEEGDATKEAERRKDRRRKERRAKAKRGPYRGFSIQVDNLNGKGPVDIEAGDIYDFNCCRVNAKETIPRFANPVYRTHRTAAWLWIDSGQKYWFEFYNGLFIVPYVRIAVRGRAYENRDICCPKPEGDIVELQREFNQGSSRLYDIEGHVFRLTRNRDTKDYISFTLLLPPEL